MNLWYEYPIPADIENQRKIIRQLRKCIQSIESRGLVQGFAFNHYYPNPSILNIRFDCTDDKLESIRKELEREVRQFVPNYDAGKSERLWDAGKSPEHVYKAYEFGSRCAFLFWELAEKGRFPEEFTSSFLQWTDATHYRFSDDRAFNFQFCFNHGVMNSLNITKIPNEQLIHLAALVESTKSSNPQELLKWIENQPNLFPKKPEG